MQSHEEVCNTPEVEVIKSNLQAQCTSVPLASWDEFATFSNSTPDIPIGMTIESPLLREEHWQGTVGIFLTRKGVILEKLVHYSSDGPDSKKSAPDEVLGETSDDRYKEFNNKALFAIRMLHKMDKLKIGASSSD